MLKELLTLNRSVSRPIEVILPSGRALVVDDSKYLQLVNVRIISRNYPARCVDI